MLASLLVAPLALALSSQAFEVPSSVLPSNLLHGVLRPRQTEDIGSLVPDECQSVCNEPLGSFTDASCIQETSCICSDEVLGGYSSCMRCLLPLIPENMRDSLTDDSKKALEELVTQCEAQGVSVNVDPIEGGDSGDDNTPDNNNDDNNNNTDNTDNDNTDTDNTDNDNADAEGEEGAAVSVRTSMFGVAGAVGALLISL